MTFGKKTAEEGSIKILQKLADHDIHDVTINARTLHSAALELLKAELQEEDDDSDSDEALQHWDDKKFKKWIAAMCHDEIDAFLGLGCTQLIQTRQLPASQHQESLTEARRKVEHFIFKSFLHFCQSPWSLYEYETGMDAMTGEEIFGRNYYPAVLYHKGEGKSRQQQMDMTFPIHIYGRHIGFYATQAHHLFRAAVEQRLFTFDICMKRAQLAELRIPGTIILVDEAQDLDGCQVDWAVRSQVKHGTHVYVVGDAAQTIYGFRGAKSQSLMDLQADQDLFLLGSFRFGQAIANIAQCVLFAKETSSQTKQKYDKHASREKMFARFTNWIPYQIHPAAELDGSVIADGLIHQWRDTKFTLIARRNATLFTIILDAFTVRKPTNEIDEGGRFELMFDADDFPKIHIAGGPNAGARMFASVFSKLRSLLDLYLGKVSSLPAKDFPEFEGRTTLSWASFVADIKDKELGGYVFARDLIETYEEHTWQAVEFYQAQVLNKLVPEDDANIILTTCHSAKGLEWDNVHICDDFVRPGKFKHDDRPTRSFTGWRWNIVSVSHKYIFDLGWSNDEINLL